MTANGASTLSKPAQTSLELRARAMKLEERLNRSREELAIARAAETEAKRALADPDPKRVALARKDLDRARDDLDRAQAVYEVTAAEVAAEISPLREALAAAEQQEAEQLYEDRLTASRGRIAAAVARKDTALAAARAADLEVTELNSAHANLLAEARAATGIGYSS